MLEIFSVPFESLNVFSILPMMIGIVGALIILMLDLCLRVNNRQLYAMLTFLFLIMDLGAMILSPDGKGFFGLITIDTLSSLGQIIVLITAVLFLPLTLAHSQFDEFDKPEYYVLFLFVTTGFQFMVSSDHLIVIFLGLETASLALYTLIALHNKRTSLEAAIKYFTMGSLAAGCFAFGAMLLYAATGHLDLGNIYRVLELGDFRNLLENKPYQPVHLVAGAVVFFLASVGFKLSLFPFHTWMPDVYEGSNSFLAGYMSIAPKIAAFVVAIRIFDIFSKLPFVHTIFYIIAIITMTLPNLIALAQDDVKRMLAYSSISHAGFAFCAILIGTPNAYAVLFFYWILFLFTNLGAFSMLWITRTKEQFWHSRYDHPYEKFSGLIKISPLAAVIMGLFMLSLAGVPPFSVFWGKLYLMSTAINHGYLFLVIVMVINSAIAAYYYLKLIVFMFLKEPIITDGNIYTRNATLPLKVVLGIAVIMVCSSFLFVGELIFILTAAITSLFW